MAIFGAIITLAIISVLVGRNSRAPEAIGAAGGFLSRVIGAAVSPSATAATNGNPSDNAFGMPPIASAGIMFGSGIGGLLQ